MRAVVLTSPKPLHFDGPTQGTARRLDAPFRLHQIHSAIVHNSASQGLDSDLRQGPVRLPQELQNGSLHVHAVLKEENGQLLCRRPVLLISERLARLQHHQVLPTSGRENEANLVGRGERSCVLQASAFELRRRLSEEQCVRVLRECWRFQVRIGMLIRNWILPSQNEQAEAMHARADERQRGSIRGWMQ